MLHQILPYPYATTVIASPLLWLVVIIIGLSTKKAVSLHGLLTGFLLGLIGAKSLSSIQPSAWGFEIIVYFFAFFWCFSVGHALIQAIIARFGDPPKHRLAKKWLFFS